MNCCLPVDFNLRWLDKAPNGTTATFVDAEDYAGGLFGLKFLEKKPPDFSFRPFFFNLTLCASLLSFWERFFFFRAEPNLFLLDVAVDGVAVLMLLKSRYVSKQTTSAAKKFAFLWPRPS